MIAPILLEGVPPDARVAADEVFGPVIVLEAVDSLDDALRAAGATRFGLQCGLFTSDLRAVLRARGTPSRSAPSSTTTRRPSGSTSCRTAACADSGRPQRVHALGRRGDDRAAPPRPPLSRSPGARGAVVILRAAGGRVRGARPAERRDLTVFPASSRRLGRRGLARALRTLAGASLRCTLRGGSLHDITTIRSRPPRADPRPLRLAAHAPGALRRASKQLPALYEVALEVMDARARPRHARCGSASTSASVLGSVAVSMA